MMRSDIEEAVLLLKRGDESAIERAVERLQQAVFAFGMKICGHREDAEDTMQEVLVKVVPYLPKLDDPGALAKWLYTVTKNRCLMSRRKSKFAPRKEISLQELMPDRQELERFDHAESIDPEKAAIRGEQGQRLREAIRGLPPHYRIILVLRDMEGFTDEEVAEITGLMPGTVRVRLHRGRLFVRQELARTKDQPHVRERLARRRKASVPPPATKHCRKMFAGLSDYLDGELDDFSCEEIEAHMEGCKPCQKFLRSLEMAIESCRRLPAECPEPKKAASLRKQLLTTYSRALANSRK